MAVYTGAAMRLEDYAKISPNKVTKGLVAALYKTNNVLKDIPLKNGTDFKATGVRLTPAGLPTPTYGELNVDPPLAKTVLEQHEESAMLMRENVTLDRRYSDNKQDYVVSPIKVQTLGLVESWARQWNTDFINNDPGAVGGNKLAPTGLFTRLNNPTKYGHAAECLINGNNLEFSATMSLSQAIQLFVLLDQALDYVNSDSGTDVVLYMNDFSMRSLNAAVKLAGPGGGWKITQDNYDQEVTMYRNAKVRNIGRKLDDTTRIIGNAEATNGALTGGNCTSIYAVHYAEEYLTGWHDGKLDLEYVGRSPYGTQDIWLLDYLVGLWHGHTRTIARIYGLATS